MIQDLNSSRFDKREPLTYLMWSDALTLERFAINCEISLAGEIDLTDLAASAKDFQKHRVNKSSILATPNSLDQGTVNVEKNDAKISRQ